MVQMQAWMRRLSELGEVDSKPMFGGQALLVDEVLVALVRDGTLYVRVGDGNAPAAFQPFPDSRLRLRFAVVDDPLADAWLDKCRQALEEVRELARKVPARKRFRAYPRGEPES